ncbi:MAG: hypothetical protein NVSMB2_03900 [Chloroflexota bacterium]
MRGPSAAGAVSAAMREFLLWVAFRPRTAADVWDAWQSHCPRFTTWEDAQDAGLVRLEDVRGRLGSARVCLTERGFQVLETCAERTAATQTAPSEI